MQHENPVKTSIPDRPDIFYRYRGKDLTFIPAIAQWCGVHRQTIVRYARLHLPDRRKYRFNSEQLKVIQAHCPRLGIYGGVQELVGITVAEFDVLAPYLAARSKVAKTFTRGKTKVFRSGGKFCPEFTRYEPTHTLEVI